MAEFLEAEALAVDRVHVHILCPYCGQIHRHGSAGNVALTNYGSRVPHCADPSQYDEYEIFTTSATIRKEVGPITSIDLKPWKQQQKQLRDSILRKRQAKADAIAGERITTAIQQIKIRGHSMLLWRIAVLANEPQSLVRAWLHAHGIFNEGKGRWRVMWPEQAGPVLCEIFGVAVR